jgi:competence protein ComEC
MAAVLLQRPAHAWTLMAAAALALLVFDPLNALDIGFQLSFAGVAGLLAWRRRIRALLPARLPAFVRDGIGSGVAATLTTAPIAAWHFGQFAPIGLPATIVASPLITLALPGIALLLLVEATVPALSGWLAPGLDLLLGLFLVVARAAAAVPFGHFPVSASTLSGLLLAAAAVLLWHAHRRARTGRAPAVSPLDERRRRRRRLLQTVQALAAAVLVLAWVPRFAPAAGHVELHVIDVGQGDAIAIRTPHGRWLLVDAGMRTDRSDMGERRVVPYLLRQGVRRIDLLLLTHAHADHIGGARAVLAAFDVAAVLDPGAPGASAQYLETLRAAAAEPAAWLAPRGGDLLVLDGVHLRFLFPGERLLDAPEDPNDYSLVFQLGYGEFGALFFGDAPVAVEEALVARHGRTLQAEVLKVGHHGSRTSTSSALLAAASPQLAVISVGRDNRYRHPSPEVLARLVRHGVPVLRTDERGSIVIRAWRSGRLRLGVAR